MEPDHNADYGRDPVCEKHDWPLSYHSLAERAECEMSEGAAGMGETGRNRPTDSTEPERHAPSDPAQHADTERQFAHWNYRVLKRSYDGEDSFEMIECYYDRYERITAWSNASPGGSTLKELEDCLQRMVVAAGLSALVSGKRKCLTLADLPGTDAPIDGSEGEK